jgi:hypothetical protein
MIARGEASPNDEFMCIGWLPPVAGSADEPAPE